MESRWSMGTLIWMPIAVILAVILVVVAVVAFQFWRKDRNDHDAGFVLGVSVCATLLLICLVGGTAWGMWPYQTEYHKWIETTGVVQEIDSRLIAQEGGGMNERFVVTFEEGNELRSCDDSRCTQVQEGDILTLMCKRLWQWSGTHGYDCNYVKHEDK